MDTAPPPLRLREEENTAQNRTEAGYRNRTNIRVVFDAHCHPCLSTQRQMSKTIKRITAVSPLLLRCWHLRSTGESADYPLDCPHPPPSKVAPHPSPDIRGRRIISRTPRLCRMTTVSPLLRHCCNLPSTEGSVYFSLDCPPPPPSTVALAPSPETRKRSRSTVTPRPYQLLIFTLTRRRQKHLRLLPPLEQKHPRNFSP